MASRSGCLDESDVLIAVHHDEQRFRDPVRSAMTARLRTLAADSSLEAGLPDP